MGERHHFRQDRLGFLQMTTTGFDCIQVPTADKYRDVEYRSIAVSMRPCCIMFLRLQMGLESDTRLESGDEDSSCFLRMRVLLPDLPRGGVNLMVCMF